MTPGIGIDDLLRANRGLVGYHATRFMRTHDVPPSVSRDDLRRAGGEGLWRACQRWQPDRSSLPTYARRKIVSNMRDLVARASRRCPLASGGMGRFADPKSLDAMRRVDDADAFAHLIRRLKPCEQAALTLRYVDDADLADIGAALGVSVSAVSHLIRTAQERLRERLAA